MIVAVVPAKDRADSVADTVAALVALGSVDRVLVVDDGSTDATTERARAAGADVLRLPDNRGKGAAVTAAVEAAPDADVFLVVDADVGATAALAAALLPPVVRGEADMTVAVLPPAGNRGGFGRVRKLAAWGIRRACGFEAAAPLSGQRAVRAGLLRSLLPLAERFGLETALTVDAVRAGARVQEIEVPMEHRHTGRSAAGFRHRARQGVDVARALWPRLTTAGQRMGAVLVAFALLAGSALWLGSRWEPSHQSPTRRPSKVLLFGLPEVGWDDVAGEHASPMPYLAGMRERGAAVAAMSVRTAGDRPTSTEGYASLGAGTRVRADEQGALAFDAAEELEGGTAAQALARRSGRMPEGDVVVVGAAAVDRQNRNRHQSSEVGALGNALRAAGKRTAVVGTADTRSRLRPAAIGLMTEHGEVDHGSVSSNLLQADPDAPFGVRADADAVVAAAQDALGRADAVLVDPGDTERAAAFAAGSTPAAAALARARALAWTDEILGRIVTTAGPDTLVLVFAVTPPGDEWHLAPIVAAGAGVRPGYLHSLSTRRLGLVTLTDLAPTVLDALRVPVPDGMIGHPLRYHPGAADVGMLHELDRDALFRERVFFRLTIGYIVLQALTYLVAIVAFTRLGGVGRAGRVLRWVVLGVSAWPLATFLFRAVPDVAELGNAGLSLLLAIDLAVVWLARRARRHPLSPLGWIAGAMVALLLFDVWTGARLQTSSLLGYSLHTAGRFTGLGNTAFAALAAATVLAVCIHVQYAPRRREALVTGACVFALVALSDGAPSLGADVGGILTLVPVFGLTLAVLAGKRVSARALMAAVGITVVALVCVALLDYLRPEESRTHLGRLVADMRADGWEPFATTVRRKVASNLRTFRSPWTWAIPVIAGYLLWMLVWARGYERLLPRRSALRAAAVGILAAGVLGNVVNDSGVIVIALMFVYIGPFFTLLALHHERGSPAFLPAGRVTVPS